MFIRNYLDSIKKFKVFYLGFLLIYVGFIAYNNINNPIEILSKSIGGLILFLIIDISFSLKTLFKVHLKKQNKKNIKIYKLGVNHALIKSC